MRAFFVRVGMWWIGLTDDQRGWIVVAGCLVFAFVLGAVLF